jgi:hypothetical protein
VVAFRGSGKNNMKEYERNHRGHREKNISVFSKKTKKIKGENNDSSKKS